MSFVVDSRSKNAILQSASTKFRTFRYTLTQKYILPFKDEPFLLKSPPERYSHIDQEQWEAFVNARISEEWEALSRVQKERRKKCKYNHQIARKGYANLAEELKLSDDPSNRATLWKVARKGKNNEYFDADTKQCVSRIDELYMAHQGKDILTEALGTPEYRGRVRGVGKFVKPSFYFNVVRGQSKLGEESINKGATRGSQSNKGSSVGSNVSNTKSKGKEIIDEPEEILEGTPCHLAIGSVDNIVAVGTMYESDVQFPTIHGVPLGANNVRVVVDMIMSEDVTIPIPLMGEIETLYQAMGNFVAWPRELVILNMAKKVSSSSKPKKDVAVNVPVLQSSNYTDVHVTIKLLNRYAMLSMQEGDTIQINLSEHVFGKEKVIYLHRDDIMHYCGMVEIGYSCIVTYIAYLWTVCDYEIIGKFMLVDQITILNYVKCQETRCRNLANRLDMVNLDLDQRVLIPYNTSYHWMLIVIHPRENTVYILNSLRSKIEESFQGTINTSLRMWQAKHSLPQYRSNIIWKLV